MYVNHCQSPLGGITLASDGDAIVGLWFDGQKYFGAGLPRTCQTEDLPIFQETRRSRTIYVPWTETSTLSEKQCQMYLTALMRRQR